jgi:mono/diheme cytochrome c family protein
MKGMTMNNQNVVRLMIPLLALFILVGSVFAGGWAIVTLTDFPYYAVAGKPLNMTFAVRQHGQTLLSGLQPTVRATTATGLVAKGAVTPGASKGEYQATLTFASAGEWTITIASGFNGNATTLPALKVIAPGTPEPAPYSPATRGVRLFTAKGCIGCHRHVEVNPERPADAKFDLTGKRFPPDYLRKFLADPSIKPAEMPNLKLRGDEIEALAAFINKGLMKQASQR